MPATLYFIVGLILGALAFGLANIFDNEPPATMARFFLGKILPLSLAFGAIVVAGFGMALLVRGVDSFERFGPPPADAAGDTHSE